jgi:hypothetical protein
MPNYSLGSSTPICYPTGIDAPVIKESEFTLYPNPSSGKIEVKNRRGGQLPAI